VGEIMSSIKSTHGYNTIADLVLANVAPSECWQKLLTLTNKLSVTRLAATDIDAEIMSVAHQLEAIWSVEPVPEDVTFLYFGLYDLQDKAVPRGRVGFYVSGGSSPSPAEALRLGDKLSYGPKHGRLKCDLLDQIRMTEAERPKEADVLDYAVMLGAAAIVVKGATQIVGVSLPVYVGFDSGDFIPMRAQRSC